ncbi:MAG: glucosyltransferase domain-containing protein [Lachnospiraceae bacterium]|nr:glucosyltransferase domain-containing protein [Lachnospiraceae bacterium]
MQNPTQIWEWLKVHIKRNCRLAFMAAFVVGVLTHAPIMLSDIPNHDGLDSLYFDQNMITSGRWFLTIACGFSSYFTLPWLIGLLGLSMLALAAAVLVDFLEVQKSWAVVLISAMLAAFPVLASTFAYVFTLDGYMMAFLFAILAVWCVKKWKKGFIAGGFFLAFSMGIYQSYLSLAVVLSIYGILIIFMTESTVKEKLLAGVKYLYMGIVGVAGYYIILQLLLKIQGKELAAYQGIDGMGAGLGSGILDTVKSMYRDFFGFTLKGNVLVNNGFSMVAMVVLVLLTLFVLLGVAVTRKWMKSPWFYMILLLLAVGIPVATNIIFVVSPNVTYHLLMRYQWVLFPICMVAFVCRYVPEKFRNMSEWLLLLSSLVLAFNFVVTDQIAYSNLEKKYEKTYAYCLRLLDRIEQTEGYYPGIPIAMIGVVGDEQFPVTNLTEHVTSGMIGMTGDYLLYTGNNYRLFMQSYLGATLNILPSEAMAEMYYHEEYVAMDSFPGENSVKIIDGIMYIKTENENR